MPMAGHRPRMSLRTSQADWRVPWRQRRRGALVSRCPGLAGRRMVCHSRRDERDELDARAGATGPGPGVHSGVDL
jgi:hypothetical protein